MNLFYQPLIPEGIRHLDAEESKHCVRVLRKTNGEVIKITDGKGFYYDAMITQADPRICTFHIQHQEAESPRNFSIHIAISPTKNADRLEWFVEKAVEFGIEKISLITCEHTERNYLKAERLEKVAVSAMKQSFRASIPSLQMPVSFPEFVKHISEPSKFIAYVDRTNPDQLQHIASKGERYVVLIGPEGDFTNQELELAIENGFKKVSLGKSRLRTETAGVAACHILNLINS